MNAVGWHRSIRGRYARAQTRRDGTGCAAVTNRPPSRTGSSAADGDVSGVSQGVNTPITHNADVTAAVSGCNDTSETDRQTAAGWLCAGVELTLGCDWQGRQWLTFN